MVSHLEEVRPSFSVLRVAVSMILIVELRHAIILNCLLLSRARRRPRSAQRSRSVSKRRRRLTSRRYATGLSLCLRRLLSCFINRTSTSARPP